MISVTVDNFFPIELTELEISNVNQELINVECIGYLSSTDWYVIRFLETGFLIPDDVVFKRVECRSLIRKIV